MNGADDGRVPSTRAQLEADANVVRRRLASRLDQLHARTRVLLEPREELRRHPREAVAVVVALGLVLCTGAAVVGYRHATRAERRRRARWAAWRRLLTHPEEVAPPRRSALVMIAEKATTAALGLGIAALVKRGVTAARAE